jgi:hypothetical protein
MLRPSLFNRLKKSEWQQLAIVKCLGSNKNDEVLLLPVVLFNVTFRFINNILCHLSQHSISDLQLYSWPMILRFGFIALSAEGKSFGKNLAFLNLHFSIASCFIRSRDDFIHEMRRQMTQTIVIVGVQLH